jgi:hypothetical protein
MECPVCYENNARCQFVCGHTFCHACTKSWYQKGESTCPMCRASICFHGIVETKKVWENEKRQAVYTDLVNQIFNELTYEYGELILHCIAFVQKRYTFMMRTYPWVSCDDLDYILRTVWIDLKPPGFDVYEPPTFLKYLMVSKSAYGIKIVYRNSSYEVGTTTS